MIESSKRDAIADKDINDIITNQFFLLDLQKVIIKNWGAFERIFIDKTKFQMYLDLINELRIDAHAKTITAEDYSLLMLAFRWFRQKLDDLL